MPLGAGENSDFPVDGTPPHSPLSPFTRNVEDNVAAGMPGSMLIDSETPPRNRSVAPSSASDRLLPITRWQADTVHPHQGVDPAPMVAPRSRSSSAPRRLPTTRRSPTTADETPRVLHVQRVVADIVAERVAEALDSRRHSEEIAQLSHGARKISSDIALLSAKIDEIHTSLCQHLHTLQSNCNAQARTVTDNEDVTRDRLQEIEVKQDQLIDRVQNNFQGIFDRFCTVESSGVTISRMLDADRKDIAALGSEARTLADDIVRMHTYIQAARDIAAEANGTATATQVAGDKLAENINNAFRQHATVAENLDRRISGLESTQLATTNFDRRLSGIENAQFATHNVKGYDSAQLAATNDDIRILQQNMNDLHRMFKDVKEENLILKDANAKLKSRVVAVEQWATSVNEVQKQNEAQRLAHQRTQRASPPPPSEYSLSSSSTIPRHYEQHIRPPQGPAASEPTSFAVPRVIGALPSAAMVRLPVKTPVTSQFVSTSSTTAIRQSSSQPFAPSYLDSAVRHPSSQPSESAIRHSSSQPIIQPYLDSSFQSTHVQQTSEVSRTSPIIRSVDATRSVDVAAPLQPTVPTQPTSPRPTPVNPSAITIFGEPKNPISIRDWFTMIETVVRMHNQPVDTGCDLAYLRSVNEPHSWLTSRKQLCTSATTTDTWVTLKADMTAVFGLSEPNTLLNTWRALVCPGSTIRDLESYISTFQSNLNLIRSELNANRHPPVGDVIQTFMTGLPETWRNKIVPLPGYDNFDFNAVLKAARECAQTEAKLAGLKKPDSSTGSLAPAQEQPSERERGRSMEREKRGKSGMPSGNTHQRATSVSERSQEEARNRRRSPDDFRTTRMHPDERPCFKCDHFGHKARYCPAPEPKCAHCKNIHLTKYHDAVLRLHNENEAKKRARHAEEAYREPPRRSRDQPRYSDRGYDDRGHDSRQYERSDRATRGSWPSGPQQRRPTRQDENWHDDVEEIDSSGPPPRREGSPPANPPYRQDVPRVQSGRGRGNPQ